MTIKRIYFWQRYEPSIDAPICSPGFATAEAALEWSMARGDEHAWRRLLSFWSPDVKLWWEDAPNGAEPLAPLDACRIAERAPLALEDKRALGSYAKVIALRERRGAQELDKAADALLQMSKEST